MTRGLSFFRFQFSKSSIRSSLCALHNSRTRFSYNTLTIRTSTFFLEERIQRIETRNMATTSNGNAHNGVLNKSTVEAKAQEMSNPPFSTANSWSQPGPAAFDFRSDVTTSPTSSMLTSIASCTLLDDVFTEDPTTLNLESSISSLTGHHSALLVLSGTMGNQLSLRTHLGAPPHSILCDSRSHIMAWEAGGIASNSGAMPISVTPQNGHHLTLEDVKKNAVISDNVHACPTKIISLENTLNGTLLPLEECQKISEWARNQEQKVIMHLDGARLWEAVVATTPHPSTPETLKDRLRQYSKCFDSMSLCFSKGLGAPIGSIIVGSQEFITRARWVRKSFGGGLRQSGVIAAPAQVAVDETFFGGKLKGSHDRAREIAGMWQSMGGKLTQPTETNMVWLDVEDAMNASSDRKHQNGTEDPKDLVKKTRQGSWTDDWIALGAKHGLRLMGGRLVVHYQIGDQAKERLRELFKDVLSHKTENENGTKATEKSNGIVEDMKKNGVVEKLKVDLE